LRCRTPIPAEPDEAAWVCAQCGQGLSLDEEQGLETLEFHFHKDIPQGKRGRPFWAVEGRVTIERVTYGRGNQDNDAGRFWDTPRRFFVPAYSCTLEDMLKSGIAMLQRPPTLVPGEPAPFEPVTLLKADVKNAAEFLIVGIEAGRKDKLKRISFSLEMSQAELWLLP
jgi:hypothetical protein